MQLDSYFISKRNDLKFIKAIMVFFGGFSFCLSVDSINTFGVSNGVASFVTFYFMFAASQIGNHMQKYEETWNSLERFKIRRHIYILTQELEIAKIKLLNEKSDLDWINQYDEEKYSLQDIDREIEENRLAFIKIRNRKVFTIITSLN